MQKLVAGLRFIKQATTETDPTAYQNDMKNASDLLTSALNGIQSIHTTLAGNQNILTSETKVLNTNISSLQDQIGDVQQVDLTAVGTQINMLQTQISASYSATATLLQLSILKYL
jgi:flagellar hook-associated protein 3 FlgL